MTILAIIFVKYYSNYDSNRTHKHIIQQRLKKGVCKIMFKKCPAVATTDHSTSERWTAVKEVILCCD